VEFGIGVRGPKCLNDGPTGWSKKCSDRFSRFDTIPAVTDSQPPSQPRSRSWPGLIQIKWWWMMMMITLNAKASSLKTNVGQRNWVVMANLYSSAVVYLYRAPTLPRRVTRWTAAIYSTAASVGRGLAVLTTYFDSHSTAIRPRDHATLLRPHARSGRLHCGRNEKSAQRRRKLCALAVVRRSQKISPRRRPPYRVRGTAKI